MWTVTITTGTGDGSLRLSMIDSGGVAGDVGNAVSNLPFAGQSYTIDKTAPTVSIGAPSTPATATGPVTFSITYADANFNMSTLQTSGITLNTLSGDATGIISVDGSAGATRTVTINSITGTGTLAISVNAGTATDFVGNLALAAGPSATATVTPVNPGFPSAPAAYPGPGIRRIFRCVRCHDQSRR